jgi:hypothetical protein
MKKLIFFPVVILFIGCSSPAPTSQRAAPETPSVNKPVIRKAALPPPVRAKPVVDYLGLQHALNLDRDSQDLGYSEKAFDTCQAGNGYSHLEDCHQEFMSVIHFQLSCRDTEGTISNSLSASDLTPIGNQNISWTLLDQKGVISTDAQGFGQIRMTFLQSPQEKRTKLNLGQQFLHMEAGDMSRIVAPLSWCTK